jgi:hypothetical protein
LPVIQSAHVNGNECFYVTGNECEVSTGIQTFSRALSLAKKISIKSVTKYIRRQVHPSPSTSVTKYIRFQSHNSKEEKMIKLLERAFTAELTFRQSLTTIQYNFFARLKDDRGDVPGWVLVVLMTTGLVTAIWTIAAPRLTAILKNSLDSMNGIR